MNGEKKHSDLDTNEAEIGLRNHGFQRWLLCWMVYILFRLFSWSYRIEYKGLEHRKKLEVDGNIFAFAFWHKNIFACMSTHSRQKIAPMISPSRDGEMIAFVAAKLGLTPIRGSNSKDGLEATKKLEALSFEGWHAAFAVDGPKGPALKVKSGVVALARDAGVAILPLCVKGSSNFVLKKTWDQMKIPKPFSKLTLEYGDPLHIPRETHGLAFAAFRKKLENSLKTLEQT